MKLLASILSLSIIATSPVFANQQIKSCDVNEQAYSYAMKLQEYMMTAQAIQSSLQDYPELTKIQANKMLKSNEFKTIEQTVNKGEHAISQILSKLQQNQSDMTNLLRINLLSLKSGKLQLEIIVNQMNGQSTENDLVKIEELKTEVAKLNAELQKLGTEKLINIQKEYIRLFGEEMCK